jgi:hypothetical protein
MSSSDDLFQLIKSLSKSEKRFFKITAAKYGEKKENNALMLFDAIDQQEDYDEAKLKKKFSGKKLAVNIASEKKNLHSLILSTVAPHSTSEKIGRRLEDMMREAYFLFDKGLYSQCRKQLKKIKELARKNEQFYRLFELFELEALLLMVTSDLDALDKLLNEEYEETALAFDRSKTQMQFLVNHYKTFIISKTHGDDTRNPKVLEEFNKIISLPLYRDENNATSLMSKHYFYFLHAVYYRHIADWKNNLLYSRKDAELYEEHPEFLSENITQYISALSNLSLVQLELMEFDESVKTLQKLRALDLKEPGLRLKADSIYFPRMAAIFHTSGEFERIRSIVEELDSFVRSKRGLFSEWRVPNFYRNTGYCYFGIGEYREALRWVNRLLNDKKLEQTREDLFSSAKLFYLFIHYELGNDDLLEHLLRSTERDLSRKGRLFEIEKVVLKFFGRIIQLTDAKEKKEEYIRFRDQLQTIYDSVPEGDLPGYFDFIAWANSKIEGRPFQEIVVENLRLRKERLLHSLEEQ